MIKNFKEIIAKIREEINLHIDLEKGDKING